MVDLSPGSVVRVVNPSAVVQVSMPGLVKGLWLKEGPVGPAGKTGPANSLSIGTVTTGAPGSLAAAAVTGTAPVQALSLTIPRGDVGAKGDKGDTGNTGPANSLSIGTVATGAAGSSAAASITGTAPSQTLSLTIPKGDTGAKGDKGDPGPTGTVTYGTTAGTAAEGNDSRITGAAQKSANLSDLTNAGTARGNLGLGTVATLASPDVAKSTLGGAEKSAALSATTGTATGDCAAASIFTVAPTGAITLAFSDVPTTGTACTVTVIVTQGATAYAVTPPTGTKWMGAAAPTQVANKACAFTFVTVNAGTTWYASAAVEQ